MVCFEWKWVLKISSYFIRVLKGHLDTDKMHLKIGYHFISKYNVSSTFSIESVQKQCKYCLTLVLVLFWRATIKINLKSCNILKNALEASYFSVFVAHFQRLVAVFKISLWNICKKYFIFMQLLKNETIVLKNAI